MLKYSKADLYRYSGNTSLKSFFKAMYYMPGYRYIFYYRLANAKRGKSPLAFLARFLLRRCSFRFGIQIPYDTEIGKGFYIGHFGTIVINSKVKIGNNCNISPGVTIGQANRGKLKGFPVIGNSVWIGTNAVLVGNINIGNDVLIAPGAYVNFDVPDHSIVLGNPGSVRVSENATEGYINRKVEADFV